MNILDSFSRKNPPSQSKERKPKKVKSSVDPERRAKKQRIAKTSILNITTFRIIVKIVGFILAFVAILAVLYFVYLGVSIFIPDDYQFLN